MTFISQVQSGINTNSSGFVSTKNGWYNLNFNFAVRANGGNVFSYSFIIVNRSGSAYYRSTYKDQGYPWEYEATHGGGFLIYLSSGQTITFTTETDSGNYFVGGFASLIKL